jgi:hypothetical protein
MEELPPEIQLMIWQKAFDKEVQCYLWQEYVIPYANNFRGQLIFDSHRRFGMWCEAVSCGIENACLSSNLSLFCCASIKSSEKDMNDVETLQLQLEIAHTARSQPSEHKILTGVDTATDQAETSQDLGASWLPGSSCSNAAATEGDARNGNCTIARSMPAGTRFTMRITGRRRTHARALSHYVTPVTRIGIASKGLLPKSRVSRGTCASDSA